MVSLREQMLINLDEDWGKENPNSLLVTVETICKCVKTVWRFLNKLKVEPPYKEFGIHSKESKVNLSHPC